MPRKIRGLILATLVWLAATSSRASAEPTLPSAGVDFVYGSINNPLPAFFGGGDTLTLIGINLHGHYGLGHGLLIGGHLPLAHVQFNDDSGTSLGNLTAELNYRLTNRPRSSSWLDVSLSLATADNNGDGQLAALTFTAFDMRDPGRYAPDTNTIRLMYRYYVGDPKLRFQFQGGVQYLSIKDVDDRLRVPMLVGGHIELGSRIEGMGRFGTYYLASAEDDEDSFLHMIEIGINIHKVGRGEVEILIYYPLDESYRDVLEVWGLQVGFTTNI